MRREEISGAEVKLDLNRVVFIGRTFDEYMQMFDLSDGDLQGRRILDCPAGACSFAAIASRQGASVTAADIVYHLPADQLAEKGLVDIEHAMASMQNVLSNFKWDYFQSIEQLRKHRIRALTDSSADRNEHPERYVPVVLPQLPFDDDAFDLTLSAHFLFTYADRIDLEFHLQSIQELLRVTKEEVRIFPLIDLANNRYEHFDKVIDHLHAQGYTTQELQVPYEFQAGANRMLVIKKA